jgi:hypothetical protein
LVLVVLVVLVLLQVDKAQPHRLYVPLTVVVAVAQIQQGLEITARQAVEQITTQQLLQVFQAKATTVELQIAALPVVAVVVLLLLAVTAQEQLAALVEQHQRTVTQGQAFRIQVAAVVERKVELLVQVELTRVMVQTV